MFLRRPKKETKERKQEFRSRMENPQVTWQDKFAMVLSAYLTLLLPAILILLAFGYLALWIFGVL